MSSLNGFASIWCCVQNMLLAATAEGLACSLRIPFQAESEYIRELLGHPAEYMFPCYLGLGHPAASGFQPEQILPDIESRIHLNQW